MLMAGAAPPPAKATIGNLPPTAITSYLWNWTPALVVHGFVVLLSRLDLQPQGNAPANIWTVDAFGGLSTGLPSVVNPNDPVLQRGPHLAKTSYGTQPDGSGPPGLLADAVA